MQVTLSKLQKLATTLSFKEAHNPNDCEDLAQEAMLAAHQSLTKIKSARRPYSMARTVMQRAMWRYYAPKKRKKFDWSLRYTELPTDAMEAFKSNELGQDRVAPAPAMPTAGLAGHVEEFGHANDLVELDDYFANLERALGRRARSVAENLVALDEECSFIILCGALQRMRQQRRLGSRQVRGVKRGIRVTDRMVRDALGIPPHEWTALMRRIREFTSSWLEVT